jgi:hypothetical protein
VKVSSRLLGFNPGDLGLEETIAEIESAGELWIAVTGQVDAMGSRLVRLVGEPNAVLTALQDGWGMTPDQARAAIEQ